MYKVIYDTIASTQNEIINFDRYKKVLNNNNLYVQSLEQEKGTGRGKKKWISPKGNIYLTINQKLKATAALKNNFYICYLIHKFFKKIHDIDLEYKWPNDLFYQNKKIVGVVVKSTILGNNSYLKTGIGININNTPLIESTSLSRILKKKLKKTKCNGLLLEIDSDQLNYIDYSSLNLDVSGNNFRPNVDKVQKLVSKGASIILNDIEKYNSGLLKIAADLPSSK